MVASAYAKVYRTNSVLTATPGQLVLMLFDGALASLAVAKEGFNRPDTDFRRYAVINRGVRKAQRIISELRGTLNFEAGGDFAPLMHRLYDYYTRRLHEANLQKRVEPIVEVEGLMSQMRDAWAEMLRRPDAARGAVPTASALPDGSPRTDPMKGAIAKASRLLAAIDQLVAEESIWLGVGDASHALASHLRSIPLLAELCSAVSDPTVAAAVAARLARLNERRERNRTRLSSLKSRLLSDGERIAGARMRLGRLSSVYGTAKSNRFRAAV